MTNEPQSVERIFEAALGLPPEQRSGFLDQACAGAPMLRHLMEQLIEEDGLRASFLGTPVFQVKDSGDSTPAASISLPFEGPPRFKADEVIAGRFEVVRFIARGGMGEVYEVKDRFLQGTSVALKIIRPHIAADPYSSRRFEQEVLLARRVNHRHLCPIYDIFHCEDAAPPFLFLTMKLLSGESLESRLKRPEGIPLDEALEICGQLMEGIEAIHSVGIIHRDIKPNNVMLEWSGSEICVTIMDFGLARLSDSGVTLSRAGAAAGTPGYLAPELIRGASPSPASDLYALGVVLHQVLTGHRPSPSRSGRAAIASPELQMSKAPIALVHAVTEFLSDDPERRFRAFEQMVPVNVLTEHPKAKMYTRRRFAIGGVATLGCVAGGSIWKWREIDDLMHPLPAKRFVALLNWPPPTDDKVTPMLLGLIDTMVDALSRAEAFDHNFYVACQRFVTEMKTPAQVNDACESLGANLILATSGTIASDGISISLKVLSAGSAKILRSRSLHVQPGQQAGLPELATRAAAQLLNISSLPATGVINPFGTGNPEALVHYQTAEALLKEPNNKGLSAAIEEFKLAVDVDPHFAKAHARLAIAYIRLFEDHGDPTTLTLARANALTALTLDSESVEGHAALAGIYQETGDLSQALREIARALAPDPSNSHMIIYQGQIYFSLNRWKEAEEAYKRVLKARPNLWLAYNELGDNYSFQGQYRLALQAFQAASITAPRNAQTVANTAQMLFLLGDLDQADSAVDRSLSLAPLSWALQIRADIMRARSKYLESLQAALRATEMTPDRSVAWLRSGDAYARIKHRGKEALECYKRALAAATEDIQVNPSDGPSWMLMALYQIQTGDRASALSSIRKADDRNAVDIYSLVYKVRILELLGQRDDALTSLVSCVNMGATRTQIESTNDLEPLISDPRYTSLARSI